MQQRFGQLDAYGVSGTSPPYKEPRNDHSIGDDSPPIVYRFAKNRFHEMRAYLQPYKGTVLADGRLWIENNDRVVVPTRMGLSVTPELLPELTRAVDALVDGASTGVTV